VAYESAKMRSLPTCLFVAASIFGSFHASGDVLIGNLTGNTIYGTAIGTSNTKSMLFTLGASDWTVDSVTLRLNFYNTVGGDIARVGF
jgi:hypothetical protein